MSAIDTTLDAFGHRIRDERLHQGLSLARLAVRVPGLSDAMLGAIERGDRRATLARAIAIAEALEVPLSVLLGEAPHRARRCLACTTDAAHARRHRELEAVAG